MYFDPCGNEPPQYELYDLLIDSEELHNLANPANTAYYNPTLVAQMQAKLEAKMAETGVNVHTLVSVLSRNRLTLPMRDVVGCPARGGRRAG